MYFVKVLSEIFIICCLFSAETSLKTCSKLDQPCVLNVTGKKTWQRLLYSERKPFPNLNTLDTGYLQFRVASHLVLFFLLRFYINFLLRLVSVFLSWRYNMVWHGFGSWCGLNFFNFRQWRIRWEVRLLQSCHNNKQYIGWPDQPLQVELS